MKKNFAALAVVAMVAAACGGDDASDAPAEEPAAEEADAPAEEAAEEPAEETGGAASEEETADALAEASEESEEEAVELPTTIEGWQELWAAERAEIVATAGPRVGDLETTVFSSDLQVSPSTPTSAQRAGTTMKALMTVSSPSV